MNLPNAPVRSADQAAAARAARLRRRRSAQALAAIVACFALSGAIRAIEFASQGPEAMGDSVVEAWREALAWVRPAADDAEPRLTEIEIATAVDMDVDDAVSLGEIETATTPEEDDPASLALEAMEALGADVETGDAGAGGLGAGLDPLERAGLVASPGAGEGAALLLAALRAREQELDAFAARLALREQAIEAAAIRVEERIEELERLIGQFSALVATVDQAAERDVEHLVGVYTRMRPGDAGELFDAMEPSFAAGFLARMRPESASAIMSAMSPQAAYAVSLELASRNLLTPGE